MSTNPRPATGPEAARLVHFTDPRITTLSRAAYQSSADSSRPWTELDWHEQHAWRTGARDWLRAAVATGLLPRVIPSTGEALAAVPLDVRPGDGRPRKGSRGRAAAFRDAAHEVRPEAFGWDGPDHHDSWTAVETRLLEIAAEEQNGTGDVHTPDHFHAALVRVEEWADQLDDDAQRAAGDVRTTDPTALIIRGLLDGSRHGEDPK